MAAIKRLLIVAHAPSANTMRLRDAVIEGARAASESLDIRLLRPFDAGPEDVIGAGAILIGTTENLGFMAGAVKDFFDRIYYPCLERTQGLAYGLYIRAGHDGTGTRRGIEAIVTGLRWRAAQEPLTLRGAWREDFIEPCRELGAAMAAALEAGII
jgi:multimeric flavodoxin WrbA